MSDSGFEDEGDERILKWLISCGLKPYEAKVYLDLLYNGVSTAREIIRRTKIPYGRIYEVLSSLSKMGYIIENQGRPKTYSAIPPPTFVRKLIERERERIKKLSEQATLIEQELLRAAYGHNAEYVFSVITGSQDIVEFSTRQILQTRSELVIFLSFDRLLQIEREIKNSTTWTSYLRALEMALRRGVNVYLLINIYNKPISMLRKLLYSVLPPNILKFKGKNIGIRICKKLATPFNIYDGERVLIKLRDPSKEDSYTLGILITDSKLANFLLEKFKIIWNECENI